MSQTTTHDDPAVLLSEAINRSTSQDARLEAAWAVGKVRAQLPAGHPALDFLDRARRAESDQRARELLREARQVVEGGDSLHE